MQALGQDCHPEALKQTSGKRQWEPSKNHIHQIQRRMPSPAPGKEEALAITTQSRQWLAGRQQLNYQPAVCPGSKGDPTVSWAVLVKA